MQIRWFVSSSLAILNVIVQMASGKGGLYTSDAYILINSRWAQTKAAHPLIMPCLWAHSAAHAWLGTLCVPDLCAARGGNVSLHGGSISVPFGLCSSAGRQCWTMREMKEWGTTSVVGHKSVGYILSKMHGAGSSREWKGAREILVLTFPLCLPTTHGLMSHSGLSSSPLTQRW